MNQDSTRMLGAKLSINQENLQEIFNASRTAGTK
jgi:hypothetical protein